MFGEFGDLSKLPPTQMQEIKDFGEQVIGLMRDHHPVPNTIFHYTNPLGFESIIRSGVIHATHIGYMNDASEYLRAVRALYWEIRKRYDNKGIPLELKPLFDELRVRLEGTHPENFPPIFVACFSELGNSLNQWRSYARGDGGFSIGFDSKSVEQRISSLPYSLVPVIYDPKTLGQLINAFIDWIIHIYPKHSADRGILGEREHLETWLNAVAGVSAGLAGLFKDEAFYEEREYRIICFSSIEHIQFKPKSNMLSGYIEIPLTSSSEGADMALLPVTEVWAGPGQYTTLNAVAAKALLRKKHYDMDKTPVVSSHIEFRVG